MPNNAIARIVSERKRLLQLVGLFIAVVILGLVLFLIPRHSSSTTTLSNGGHTYTLTLATTSQTQEKGLGDRSSLPIDQGMLFVFSGESMQCFWMKDMHFSLDMIWVGTQKQVLFVKSDVSPNTYPESFCPNVQAQYVIELNAGQAKTANIQVGDTLNF
jgi:uncharacterized membrane protein (UPF0127 family)